MDRIYVQHQGFAHWAWAEAIKAASSETQAEALAACLRAANLSRQAWELGFGGPALAQAEQAVWASLQRFTQAGALQG